MTDFLYTVSSTDALSLLSCAIVLVFVCIALWGGE